MSLVIVFLIAVIAAILIIGTSLYIITDLLHEELMRLRELRECRRERKINKL